MGKSNRIRVTRADTSVSNAVKFKKKQGMPLWLQTVIAVVVTIAVLATCFYFIFSANGFFDRHTYPMRSEHFKVSVSMMDYYYQKQISNFEKQNSNYMSYFSLDLEGDLREQTFGDTSKGTGYEAQLLDPDFKGTWHDYFVSATKDYVNQILMLCEEAHARGIDIEDADTTEMTAELMAMESAASMYGYSMEQLVSMQYGEGMKLKDVKRALELTALASEALLAVQEEVVDSITEEDIDKAYAEDPDSFNYVDYFHYTANVSYNTVAEEILGKNYTEADHKAREAEVLAAYKEDIDALKDLFTKLAASKTLDDFKKVYFEYEAAKQYDLKYNVTEIDKDKLPDEDTRKAIKDAVVADIVAEILAEKTTPETPYTEKDGVYTVAEKTVTKEFAELVKTVKSAAFTSVYASSETYAVEKGPYTKDDPMSEWLFKADRKVGDVDKFYTGDGAESDDITAATSGSFTGSACIVTKTKYRDDSLAKTFEYITFTNADDAAAALAKFKEGTISLEAFKALAADYETASSSTYEDYTEGSFGIAAFDTWLFADDTKIGSYTSTPISSSASTTDQNASYIIAYYHKDGNPVWRVYVKSAIFYERYDEFSKSLEGKYEIKVKESSLNKIG